MLNRLGNFVRCWPWYARYPALVLGGAGIFVGLVFHSTGRFVHETLSRWLGYRVWVVYGLASFLLALLITGQLEKFLIQLSVLILLLIGLWMLGKGVGQRLGIIKPPKKKRS